MLNKPALTVLVTGYQISVKRSYQPKSELDNKLLFCSCLDAAEETVYQT